MQRPILVTGGAGFIGAAVVRRILAEPARAVVNVDKLTYAAAPELLAGVEHDPRYAFERVDVCDAAALRRVFDRHRPAAVLHLAAESHVDRGIDGPAAFVHTNLVGTFTLLEEARRHWGGLGGAERDAFRFVHVSTDEVFGTLGDGEGAFGEASPYRPRSPYSATKAGADHLVRAWHHTYGLPTLVTHGSNSYGPGQFPEKLVPLMIINALQGRPLPVYGHGQHVREWLHVRDHAEALVAVLERGRVGETYCVGGGRELRNREMVRALCALVDELAPDPSIGPREALVRFVADRPGHDLRYAMDASRIERELGWVPRTGFEAGLRETVAWYLANRPWWERVRAAWGARAGLAAGAAA